MSPLPSPDTVMNLLDLAFLNFNPFPFSPSFISAASSERPDLPDRAGEREGL